MCPRCGTENPADKLFCQNCDWRLDMEFRPERASMAVQLSIATFAIGALSIVCLVLGDTELVAALLGAVALVLGGYSFNIARIRGAGKTYVLLSGIGLFMGIFGFLLGFVDIAGGF